MTLKVESYVNECYVGVIGMATGVDSSDCSWMRYYPQTPIWSYSMLQKWDSTSQYMDWKCNYESVPSDSVVEPDNTKNGLEDEIYDPFEVSNVDSYGNEYGIEDPTNTNNEVF